MCIILPGRDEQVEVGLLARAVQGRGVMKGIGDRQPRPGNGVHQVPRQCQVLPVREFLRQRDFPFFKGHPVHALVAFRRTKVRVWIARRPGREVARAFVDEVLAVLAQVAQLPVRRHQFPLGLPGNILEPLGGRAAAAAVHGALKMEVCHQASLRSAWSLWTPHA